ncbi:EAL domain, c-di-GMP-specific phosphodiesterase class I (or its enzymatically inactive variant) [Oribacterium sp. KHPX15]|uniref:EAL domain-containing protein n=1 Tax=Oribacterium sp. KHPX15 TaxID=1855342 RepID=UPI000899BFF9|nr:EAL domain-containing protein [Oribacterium sp. KHPX15]SEA85104.1 EAL domain, c-di-GMP-specific phosphodiesterase class I (or its enzymatically inactive variant) [Oribacterium sp. KHPX15]
MSTKVNDFTNADYSKDYILNGLKAMPGGFFIYKADWEEEQILYANQAILDLFECESNEEFQELTGGSFKGMVYPEDYERIETSIKIQIDNSEEHFDKVHYRIMTKTGKILEIEDIAKLYEDPAEGPLFYVFVSTFESTVDQLTGLLNREYFMKSAKAGCNKLYTDNKKPVVIAFDFNGMENFSSRYGLEEADNFLLVFSNILKKYFPTQNCARFGSDHFFVYAESEGIEILLNQLIGELHSANNGRTLTVRMGIINYLPEMTMNEVCDKARIAADTLVGIDVSDYAWYDDSIIGKQLNREYILHTFDQALAEGWIEPYYQPVVRSLTGRVCAFEAFARWHDPEYGILTPLEFLPVLEENGLAYRLDMYIIGKVADMLQQRLDNGQPVVTVGVNISKTDFEVCDPVSIISSVCDSHGISRNLISIDISETVLMRDRELVSGAIDRLHDAGFEVWMDDFGAGYSALSALKDFNFDGIKINFAFLKDLNDRAREILKMTIKMVKALGIHTSAEGIETGEQNDFLKNIGCERIQGNFHIETEELDVSLEHMKEKGLLFESLDTYGFYQKAGLTDVISKYPKALFFFDGKQFSTLYKNEAYVRDIDKKESSSKNLSNLTLGTEISMNLDKLRKLACKAIKNNRTEGMIILQKNRNIKISFAPVVSSYSGHVLSVSMDVIDRNVRGYFEGINSIMETIMSVYECIYLIDYEEDSRTVITSTLSNENDGEVIYGLKKFYDEFVVGMAHINDLERLRRFLDKSNIEARFKSSDRGCFSEIFLVKQNDGSFKWTEFLFVLIPETEGKKYYVCVKPAEIEETNNKEDIIGRLLETNQIDISKVIVNKDDAWTKAFLQVGNIKMFWKDRERRFVGASDAFLKYYNFRSIDEILGKTDEDLQWHIDDNPYRTDELHVIERGETVINAPGKIIVGGVPRSILANKFPTYQDGKIIGLVGYFVDVEQDLNIDSSVTKSNLIDPLTGLLNSQGMMLSMLEFDENFKANGQDYIYTFIHIEGYNDVLTDYGEEIAEHLIKLIAKTIKRSFRDTATIARTYGCYFAVCEKGTSTDSIAREIRTCLEEIKNIKEVEKCRCSLTMTYGLSMGSEAINTQDIIDIAKKRQQISFQRKGINLAFSNTEVIPDVYRDLPLPYVVFKPVMDDAEVSVLDIKYLFVNQKYSEMTGITKKELLGKGYIETFPRADRAWLDYTYRAVRGEYVNHILYDEATRHWIHFTAAPSVVPGTCAVICEVVDGEMSKENRMSVGQATMEELVKLARILDTESNFKTAVNDAFKFIGSVTGASRVYIFETDRRTFDNTFEWYSTGIDEGKNKLQQNDYRYISLWEKYLEKDTSVVIENVNLLKFDYPEGYNYLKSKGINWMISAPMYHRGKLLGYLGVDNFDHDKAIDIRKFIENAAYFMSSRLKLHEFYNKMSVMESEHDANEKRILTQKSGYKVVEILSRCEEPGTAINDAIRKMGEILTADRIALLEMGEKNINNTYEWRRDNVFSLKEKRGSVTFDNYIGMLSEAYNRHSAFIIGNIEDIKDYNAGKYKFLKENDISRFIEVPLYDNTRLAGVLVIDNYSLSLQIDVGSFLEMISILLEYMVVARQHDIEIKRKYAVTVDNNHREDHINSKKDTRFKDLTEIFNVYEDISLPSYYVNVRFNGDGTKAEDFIFMFVNRAYCKFVKRKPEEMLGKSYKEVFLQADPQLIADIYEVSVLGLTKRDIRYDAIGGCWMETVIMPVSNTGFCVVMLLNHDASRKEVFNLMDVAESDKSNAVVVRTAEIFNEEKDDDLAIRKVLEELGDHVAADHIYLMLADHSKNTFSERYEWCADGVRPNLGVSQKVDKDIFERIKAFKRGKYFCEDISSVKNADAILYDFLKTRNIRNSVQVPLKKGEEIIGYFGADNVAISDEKKITDIMLTVSYFISARIIVAQMDM